MANPFKGEVLIEDDGRVYKFVFGMYAQVILEEMIGESWSSFWARAKDWSSSDVLTLFRAGLARHHEAMVESAEGKREIADLMDRLGPTRCSEIVNEAVTKAMPKAVQSESAQAEDAKDSARPLKKPRMAHASIT